MKNAAAILKSDGIEEAEPKLAAAGARPDDRRGRAGRRLEDALAPLAGITPEDEPDLDGWGRFLTLTAAQRPLVCLFEDVQDDRRRWSSSSTSPTARAGSCSSSRRRGHERGGWALGRENVTHVDVGPLGDGGVARLLESLDADVPPELARRQPAACGRARPAGAAAARRRVEDVVRARLAALSAEQRRAAGGGRGRRADVLGRRGRRAGRAATSRRRAACSTRPRPPSCSGACASRRWRARPSTRSCTRSCARSSTPMRRPGAPPRRRRVARPGARRPRRPRRAGRVPRGRRAGGPAELRERVEALIREHELIEPGGAVDVPRLRRRRLDLPLARPARARLRGLRAAREPRPARRRVRRGRAFLPRGARRRGGRRARRHQDVRPSCATSATPYARAGLRATGHTASDQVETVLYRLVSRGETRGDRSRSARTASSARSSTSGATRPRRTAARRPRRTARTPRTRTPQRGLIRARSCRCSRRLHPGADTQPPPRRRPSDGSRRRVEESPVIVARHS